MCLAVCLCKFGSVCLCGIVHIHFFHPRQIFESIILLFDPLCEIVDIAFSVEVPIGVSHTADNNRRLIWSSIVHMHTLYTHFCSVLVGLSELHCKSVWFYEECRCKSSHSLWYLFGILLSVSLITYLLGSDECWEPEITNNRHIRALVFIPALKQWTCVRAIVSPSDCQGRLWKPKHKNFLSHTSLAHRLPPLLFLFDNRLQQNPKLILYAFIHYNPGS